MSNHTSSPDESDVATRIRRLRFRSWHRGTREMDLILGGFADKHLDGFSNDELDQYEAMLGENDPDIYNWITGREPAPNHADTAVLKAVADHVAVKGSVG